MYDFMMLSDTQLFLDKTLYNENTYNKSGHGAFLLSSYLLDYTKSFSVKWEFKKEIIIRNSYAKPENQKNDCAGFGLKKNVDVRFIFPD